jgi:AI-2 transport protein TqsA
VLVPLLLALLFTYCLQPIVEVQVRHLRLPRIIAVGTTVLFGLAMLALVGFLVTAFVNEMQSYLPRHRQRIEALAQKVNEAVPLGRLGLQSAPGQVVTVSEETWGRLLSGLFSSAADIASGGGLVLIFMVFFLVGSQPGLRPADSLLGEIEHRVQRYILQMAGFSIATGVLVGLCLAMVGVDFAFTFGFIAFLLNFIPTIGPLIATLLPLPIVLLDPELSVSAKVLALALPAAVQGTFAVLQPRAQSEIQNLHPVTIIAALVFFGSIWGILGAALAVPLTGVIKIVLERIPATRPAAGWLEGKLDFPRPAPAGPSSQPPANHV